jgi:hypothetical protein
LYGAGKRDLLLGFLPPLPLIYLFGNGGKSGAMNEAAETLRLIDGATARGTTASKKIVK